MPDSPQFSPVNPQMSPDAMPPATPTKKPKTGLIVTIVIVAVLVVALIGLFIANAVVASSEEDKLKSGFTKEGFSQVQAETANRPQNGCAYCQKGCSSRFVKNLSLFNLNRYLKPINRSKSAVYQFSRA